MTRNDLTKKQQKLMDKLVDVLSDMMDECDNDDDFNYAVNEIGLGESLDGIVRTILKKYGK